MKYFWTSIIFLITLAIFMILEYGQVAISFNELIQPIIFSFVTAAIFLTGKSRKAILWISLILLILMVLLYLSNSLVIANWVGGLGTGIFTILIFSYLPKLTKDGHI